MTRMSLRLSLVTSASFPIIGPAIMEGTAAAAVINPTQYSGALKTAVTYR